MDLGLFLFISSKTQSFPVVISAPLSSNLWMTEVRELGIVFFIFIFPPVIVTAVKYVAVSTLSGITENSPPDSDSTPSIII